MGELGAWVMLVAGGGLLFFGAEALVRGASALALRLRMAPVVVGMTVVAFGTSAPEVGVSARAAWAGAGDVALGNVVGSNICNVGLILGACALLRPMAVETRLVRVDVPIVLAASLVFPLLLLDARVDRLEGALLLLALTAHTWVSVLLARRERSDIAVLDGVPAVDVSIGTGPAVLYAIGGLAVLLYGADLFVRGGTAVALEWGVSQAAVALTLIALGTSLPELATSLVAALRGTADLAIGNVVGSNLFNLLGVVGVSAALRPVATGGVAAVDYVAMILFAAVLLPLLATGFRLVRWEGALLLGSYAAYVALCLA